MRSLVLPVIVAVFLVWAPAAYAQGDAGTVSADTAAATDTAPADTAPAPAPADTAAPTATEAPAEVPVVNPDTDPSGFLETMLRAIQTDNWKLLGLLIIIAAVWLVRQFGGKKWAVLRTDRAGAITVLIMGTAGAIATAIGAGADFSPKLILNGLMMGVSAAGGWSVLKKLIAPSDKKPAEEPADKPADKPDEDKPADKPDEDKPADGNT